MSQCKSLSVFLLILLFTYCPSIDVSAIEHDLKAGGSLQQSAKQRLKSLDSQIKKEPNLTNLAQLHLLRSIANEDLDRYNDAIVDITHAIRLNPAEISFYIRRGGLFDRIEKYKEAQRDYQIALNIVPSSGKDCFFYAQALTKLNRYEEAAKILEKAILKGYKSHKVFRLKGKTFYRLEKYDQAIIELKRAIAIKPTSTTYLYLALCYKLTGKLTESLAILRQAHKLEPASARVALDLAIVLYRLNRLDQAKDQYILWKRMIPETLCLYPTWQSFVYLCETDQKIDYYTRLIALSRKRNAAPVYERALLYLALARYDKAAEEMTRYLTMTDWQGRSGILAASYAYICYRLSGHLISSQTCMQSGRKRLKKGVWPYPIWQYLTSSGDENSLFKSADTPQKKTQVNYFVALNQIYLGKSGRAIKYLTEAKSSGDKGVDEYVQALAELDRLRHRAAVQKLR